MPRPTIDEPLFRKIISETESLQQFASQIQLFDEVARIYNEQTGGRPLTANGVAYWVRQLKIPIQTALGRRGRPQKRDGRLEMIGRLTDELERVAKEQKWPKSHGAWRLIAEARLLGQNGTGNRKTDGPVKPVASVKPAD